MAFLYRPNLGRSFYTKDQERDHIPTLVEGGYNVGGSKVKYEGANIGIHLWTRDFFITIVNLDTHKLLGCVAIVYLIVFLFWSGIWMIIMKYYPSCLNGDQGSYAEAFAFSVITQMTIGYGNTNPGDCWTAAWLVTLQAITALLLESITLGVIFARISHPSQRSRSIFISNKAVIARRDGILKFMFRVADIRSTQVVEPRVKVYMYTWGEGRVTAEGERIPVRVEPLEVDYIDGMLLLPLIIEHTIDERSPLCGHTLDSLQALGAEIVVTFEGTTEMGNPFMARRSYIPSEIYWGHQFKNIIKRPVPGDAERGDGVVGKIMTMGRRLKPGGGGEESYYMVDLENFHGVDLAPQMPMLVPSQLSQLVVNRARKTVPYPLLGENTLVLSDVLTVAPGPRPGTLRLACRVGDTYPNQMLEITVRMYLYRWNEGPVKAGQQQQKNGGGGKRQTVSDEIELDKSGSQGSEMLLVGRPSDTSQSNLATTSGTTSNAKEPFEMFNLECGYETGEDRLFLRLPSEVIHVIDADSPLSDWLQPDGMAVDIRSEIVVVINAYMHVNSQNRLRQRTYRIDHHVKYGCVFTPIVRHPMLSKDRKPRVRWQHFHDTEPVEETEEALLEKMPRQDTLRRRGEGPPQSKLAVYLDQTLSPAPESHASLRGKLSKQSVLLPPQPTIESMLNNELRNDYTVLAADLARYAATVGDMDEEDLSSRGGNASASADLASLTSGGGGRNNSAAAINAALRAPIPDFSSMSREGKEAGFALFPGVVNYALDSENAEVGVGEEGGGGGEEKGKEKAEEEEGGGLKRRKSIGHKAVNFDLEGVEEGEEGGGGDEEERPSAVVVPNPVSRQLSSTEVALQRSRSRMMMLQDGEPGDGPMHFSKPNEAWEKRALSNLFGDEDPEAAAGGGGSGEEKQKEEEEENSEEKGEGGQSF